MNITSSINRSVQRNSDLNTLNDKRQSAALSETGSASLYEQNVLNSMVSGFTNDAQANPEKLTSALHQSFGDKATAAQIDQLAASIISGDVPIPESIEFVNAGTLGTDVSGVYIAENGGRILIDASLLNDPAMLQRVFTEELGHHFDATLGGVDSAGDEGAIFAETLLTGSLSEARLQAFRNEDDSGVVTIDGRTVEVEQFYGGVGSSEAAGGSPSPSPSPSYSGPGSSSYTGGSPSPTPSRSSSPSPTTSYSGPGSSSYTGGSPSPSPAPSPTPSYSGPGSSPYTGGSSSPSPSPRPTPNYSGPGSSPYTGGYQSPTPSPTPSYSGPGSSLLTGGTPNLATVTPDPDEQTPDSHISAGGLVGSTLAGAIDLGADHVDRFGRQSAAGILTNGPAGRLPAPGFINRTDLANTITDARMSATTALDATPFSANAGSTQALESTLNQTNTLGRLSGVVGNTLGIGFGAYEGFSFAPENATFGEKFANVLGGGLKEVDDTIVSGVAGIGAGTLTVLGGAAISTGGVTLPAGAAVIASAPVVGTAASIAASNIYDETPLDTGIDNFIDNTFEPAVASTIDTTISAYDRTKSWGRNTLNSIISWFR